MGDGKKISFGFSKLSKKTSIVPSKLNTVKVEDNKVEFIDCLEGKSIKLKDPALPENKILVIPLKSVSLPSKNGVEDQTHLADKQTNSNSVSCKQESPIDDSLNVNKSDSLLSIENKKLTLDQIAAKEILEEISKKKDKEETRIFSVPLTSSAPEGEKESTIDDYDSVPVNQFGLAMLRGMGWAPGKGIGKNEQLVTPSLPTLRPKGMGLGADKYVKPQIENSTTGDVLTMSKGCYIRVVAGTHKDNYGQIEGFDEESGRVIVKLVLQNITVSLNEFMIQVVDKTDFTKNSKVINVGKYEQYKNEEIKGTANETVIRSNVNSSSKSDTKTGLEYDTSDFSENTYKNSKSEKSKKEKFCSARKPREKYSKSQSRSSTSSPEGRKTSKSNQSRSPTRKTSNLKIDKYSNYHKEKKISKNRSKYRHSSSSSSSSSDSSSSYSRKKRQKGSSSYRRSERSRSRSPRKHSSHSKHKKSKYS